MPGVMEPGESGQMNSANKKSAVLIGLSASFSVLAVTFLLNLEGQPPHLDFHSSCRHELPRYLDRAPVLCGPGSGEEDLSDFDCYVCHEQGKPPTLRYDSEQNLIIPKEHSDM